MFKILFDAWKTRRNLKLLTGQYLQMLDMDRQMLLLVVDALKGRRNPHEIRPEIYRRDIEINKCERAIRKGLGDHLSAHPEGDAPTCLVLMSIVKDAERIGDYAKNLVGTAQLMDCALGDLTHGNELVNIADHVTGVFDKTIRAFSESNVELAKGVVEDEGSLTRTCDELISRVARSDLSANEAVCTAMLVRFFKRVDALLSNIASSVVLPVHRLDGRLAYEKKSDPKEAP